MSHPWRDDDDQERTLVGAVVNAAAKIRRPRQAVLEVVDLPVLRPEHERVAKFVGKWLGIGLVYLVAGAIWGYRGIAWAVRNVRIRVQDQERLEDPDVRTVRSHGIHHQPRLRSKGWGEAHGAEEVTPMGLSPFPAPRRPKTPWSDQGSRVTEPRARAHYAPQRVGTENPATQPGRGRGGRLGLMVLYALWRYWRELAPLAVLTAMALIAAIGHAASEELAWLPLVVAVGVGAWLALRAHRPIHRWYVAGAGAAGIWMAAAWWVGLWDPLVLALLVTIAVVGPTVWWAHHRPRSRVKIIGGSRWPWEWSAYRFQQRHKRRLNDAIQWWPLTAQQARVPRVQPRQAIAAIDSPEYVLVVDLHGHAVADLAKARNWIESGLRARRATLRIEQDPEWAHLARIVWRRDDAAEGSWEPEIVKPEAGEEEAS